MGMDVAICICTLDLGSGHRYCVFYKAKITHISVYDMVIKGKTDHYAAFILYELIKFKG